MKFDELALFEKNYANNINNLQPTLNLWSVMDLTLLEKITDLKTLVIPKHTYKATYLPIHLPKKFVKRLNRVLFSFIWGSKWENIGRSQLYAAVLKREEQK